MSNIFSYPRIVIQPNDNGVWSGMEKDRVEDLVQALRLLGLEDKFQIMIETEEK